MMYMYAILNPVFANTPNKLDYVLIIITDTYTISIVVQVIRIH